MSKSINTVLIFIGLWSIYLLSVAGPFASSDDVVMIETAYRLATEGHFYIPNLELPQVLEGYNNRFYSKYDPGLPLLTAPVMWVAAWVAGQNGGADSFVIGAYFAMVIPTSAMALAVAGLYRLADYLYTPHRAVFISLVAALGTTVWPYARLFFAEAILTAALVWALFGIVIGTRWSLGIASLALGIGILTRASFVIYLPALMALWWWRRDLAHPARVTSPAPHLCRWMLLAIGPSLAIGGLLWHNALRFGSPTATGYSGESFSTPLWEGIIGLLFSPGKSIFLYAPPLVLCLWGWRQFHRHNTHLATSILLMSLTGLGVYGTWWAWHGGWVWGSRFLVPLMPLWCLALPPLTKRHAIPIGLIVAAGVSIQLLGVFTDVTPAYTQVFEGANANDETRYAMVHYHPAKTPLANAIRQAREGNWQPQAVYNLGHTHLSEGWVSGIPTVVNLMLWVSSIGIGWSLWKNRSLTTADKPSWKG